MLSLRGFWRLSQITWAQPWPWPAHLRDPTEGASPNWRNRFSGFADRVPHLYSILGRQSQPSQHSGIWGKRKRYQLLYLLTQ